MSIKEASDITEQWLEDQIQRNLATNRMKAKASPQPSKEGNKKEASTRPSATATESPRTITNNMTSAPTNPNSNPGPDTESDRIRRAMAALDRIA